MTDYNIYHLINELNKEITKYHNGKRSRKDILLMANSMAVKILFSALTDYARETGNPSIFDIATHDVLCLPDVSPFLIKKGR